MKRKLVMQGGSALTVSLPAKWAQKYGLKAGDEVDVEEAPEGLIVAKEFKHKEIAIKLNFKNFEPRHMKWAIVMSYKKGYNEMRITFDKPEDINIIEEVVNLTPGLEIINQDEKSCVIKNIAKEMENEFDNSMRRNFLNSLSMVELCLKKIKEGKLEELKEAVRFEEINNKLCLFCQRIANLDKSLEEKKVFYYVVIWYLEKIVDEFKYIGDHYSAKENSQTKISKEVIDIFEDVCKIFRKYYDLYYSFDLEKQVEITNLNNSINKRGLELLANRKSKDNVMVYYLLKASEKITESLPSLLAINSEFYEVKDETIHKPSK
jgi:phosphate uptake regulator